MNCYRVTLQPRSAFGSRPLGDMLFGQLCWTVRNRHGEAELTLLLDGYTDNKPWLVVSDAFPCGHLPRPSLPSHWYDSIENADRKVAKKRLWLPIEYFNDPVDIWLNHCKQASALDGCLPQEHPQPHNTINRATGTTGEGQFAPYAMSQYWYGLTSRNATADGPRLDVYVVLDEQRFPAEGVKELFADMGRFGFGRDASIGLGKFEIDSFETFELPAQSGADAWLTLAPCSPQGQGFDAGRSFYTVFTRFGRHGDIGVHLGNPFKTPVMMAETGAVFSPGSSLNGLDARTCFIGKGLGGGGRLSKIESLRETVHQGYAPVIGIRLPIPAESRAETAEQKESVA